MKQTNKAQIFHYDLYGKREDKYDFLNNNSINSINWNNLEPEEPNYFFVPKDFGEQESYEMGFKVDEMFVENVAGIETIRDSITIHFKDEDLKIVVTDFISMGEKEIGLKYKTSDARDWKINRAKEDIKQNFNNPKVYREINYRPFDIRKTFYSGKQNGFVCNGRYNVMKHLLNNNIGLIAKRGFDEDHSAPCFVTKYISDRRGWTRPGMQGAESIFPLYLYPDNIGESNNTSNRTPNLNMEIVNKIAEGLGLKFTPEIVGTGRDLSEKENQNLSAKENEPVGTNRDLSEKNNIENQRTGHDLSLRDENDSDEFQRTGHGLSLREIKNTFAPLDILDYIYAVLHSPTYREKYKEFLKIDFPRVPYPHNVGTNRDLSAIQNKFWQLVKLGGELRQIHLLESAVVENYITQYPIDGNNEVVKPVYKDGKVFINDTQYFANVPEVAWNFYIGGYQPAQKWLKDRKGRKLDFDDIFHYQKIIVALSETDRIMKEIDEIGIE